MAINADVFSWGRNIEGQLGDNTTVSTFTSAASGFPVTPSGASDNFDVFNEGDREIVVRGVTVDVPPSAARWRLTGEVNNGNDNFVVEDNKLKWDGTGDTSAYTVGTLASAFRLQQYRWMGPTGFEITVDWDLLTWNQPSSSDNAARILIWVSSSAYVIVGRRYTSGGTDETYIQGSTTGTVSWVGAGTNQTSGSFKIEYVGSALIIYAWNDTAQQWEWDGNTAGYTVTEDLAMPVVIFQMLQQAGAGMNVEFSNFNVIGEKPYGNNAVSPYKVPTPGYAYWPQPQSRFAGGPFLEFSGDTPGTTANLLQRIYRTYDGSLDTFGPILEGATPPLYTVQSNNLYFNHNSTGARDLHPMIWFNDDFEVIWKTNIISAPNTCCWSVRMYFYQPGDVRGGSLSNLSFEPEYGYSGARRYRLWKNDGTGGAWTNGASRTDAVIRIKVIYTKATGYWQVWAWYNNMWNAIGSNTMTQTTVHAPTVFTWRFSNWSSYPGFQADIESLTIVPSGTPDGSFYWADAPMVPSPSGYTDETAMVVGEPNFIDMAGGKNHAIGLKEDGSAHAWGDNQFGQLGDGTLVNRSSPVSVQGGLFTELAPASDHNLALKDDFSLWAWGRNDFGQLGSPAVSGTDQSSPISIGSNFIGAATGLDHSLAIDKDYNVWAWGRNQSGQLGTGDTTDRVTPTLVSGLPAENFVKVTGGAKHSCAMTEDGDVWCWGDNTYTQSAPSSASIITPTLVASGAIDVDAGGYHNIILDENYRAWAWGRNDLGQLGDNSLTQKSTPTSIYGGHRFIDISAGEHHSWAMKADGTVCTWGAGDWGKLLWHTDENPRSKPVCGTTSIPCVPFLPNTGNFAHSTFMECGSQFIAWTWGCNTDGKLGDGTISNKSTPTQVIGNKKWIDMSGGGNHTLAIDQDGHIYAWGDDSKGQLGDG